jgi:hypothetical protein
MILLLAEELQGKHYKFFAFCLSRLNPDSYNSTGYRIPDTGYRIPDTGYRIPDTGYRILKNEK